VLDDHVAVEARSPQAGEQRGPLDVAEPGQARDLPADPEREHAAFVEGLPVDRQVLGLHVEDVRPELPDEPRDVDHLQDEVRRIEVEPDRAAPLLEDPAPDARRRREVVPTRPLVVAEEHRAVLDRDLAAMVLRECHDVRPDLERLLPVRVLGLCGVGAHERVHEGDVHLLGRGDHVPQVADDGLPVRRIRMQRVRVVAQAGDRQALALDLVDDLGRP
jgi:hypothetical protein